MEQRVNRIDQVIGLLENEIGYSNPLGVVEKEYAFVKGNGKKWIADALAFGDPSRLDISTACIAVEWVDSNRTEAQIIGSLRYVGVPIVLLVSPDGVRYTYVPTDENKQVHPSEHWTYDKLRENLLHHKRELEPKFLLKAKRAGYQMSFFALDPSLEIFARQATQKTLVEQFTFAIASVPKSIRKKHPAEVTTLAIWVLAARILQDKLIDYEDLQSRNPLHLLRALKIRYKSYFHGLEAVLSVVGNDTLDALYTGLLGDFTFRSLTNDMLAYFYENTLVDDELKQALGIFYTPRHLTERILKRLPLEDLAPEHRTVFDGSSGSGNFLLSAYDRLESLLPVQWPLRKKHNYLLRHLIGMDIDSFATEVAKLSLLHYDLPAGNSWKIEHGDFLEIQIDQLDSTVNIVVTNPPFQKKSIKKREQLAATILQKYLDILPQGGLLGIVLPLTMLDAAHSIAARQQLLDQCCVLEVWHLHQGVVPTWSSATAVILARKIPQNLHSKRPCFVRINEIVGTDRVQFQKDDIPTSSYIVPQSKWMQDLKYRMTSSPIDSILDKLDREFNKIRDVAPIWNGVKPGSKARATHFHKDKTVEHNRKVLYTNIKAILEPYRINWKSQDICYIKYPGELERSRTESHFDHASKVIMNATRNAGGRWRFFAAVDTNKIIPTENFHYSFPIKDRVTSQQVAAVLNSPVANAWYASKSGGRDVSNRLLNNLPFPKFTDEQREQIEMLVNKLTELKRGTQVVADLKIMRNIVKELDQIVFDAYGLTIEQQVEINNWFNLSPRPRPGIEWSNLPFSAPQTGKLLPQYEKNREQVVSGTVISIHPATNTMHIEIDNVKYQIPIPSNAPGWMLAPNAMFDAVISGRITDQSSIKQLAWLDFELTGYGYLSNDDLLAKIKGAWAEKTSFG